MPIFEYTCKQCKKEFERVVFSGEEKGIVCPECKSKDVKKKHERINVYGQQYR